MHVVGRAVFCAAIAVAALSQTKNSHGYVTFGQGYGSKWGDPNAGTPGVVTWGFMKQNTTVDPNFRLDPDNFPNSTGFQGNNDIDGLRARVDGQYGTGTFNGAITRAMDTWSAVANIRFVGPVTDPGLPFPSQGATNPDIRIGAFRPATGHSFDFYGAVGFGPPGPFGNDPLAGDIIFNFDAHFFVPTGAEDTSPHPEFGNDLEGLFLHELGHAAIGLGHPSWEGARPDQRVMYVGDWQNPEAPWCCETINRFPHPDDIAGAQFVYGPPSGISSRAGDIDLDGDVDRRDAALFSQHLGTASGATWTEGDFDFDGATTLADLSALQTRLSGVAELSPDFASVVPEPSTAPLLALATLWIGMKRTRRRVP